MNWAFCWTLLAAACSVTGEKSAENPLPRPELFSAATDSASLGRPLDFKGRFPACTQKTSNCFYALEFSGTFQDAGAGTTEQIAFRTSLVRVIDTETLRFLGFGPSCNPFSKDCNKIGKFQGQVTPIIFDATTGNENTGSTPLDYRLSVTPSVFVTEFTPKSFDCGEPVQTTIVDTPYRLCAKAVGSIPAMFRYVVTYPGNEGRFPSLQFEHAVGGKTLDCLGDAENFVTPEKQPDLPFIAMAIAVQIIEAGGKSYDNTFATTVHFPIEIYQDERTRQVELMEPKPATGCLTTDKLPANNTFTITQSEELSRSMTLSVSKNKSISSSTNTSISLSESTSFSTSDSTGVSEVVAFDGKTISTSLSSSEGTAPASVNIQRGVGKNDGEDKTYTAQDLQYSYYYLATQPDGSVKEVYDCGDELEDAAGAKYALARHDNKTVCTASNTGVNKGESEVTSNTDQITYVGAVNGPNATSVPVQVLRNGEVVTEYFQVGDLVSSGSGWSSTNSSPQSLSASGLNIPPISALNLMSRPDIQGVATSANASKNASTVFSRSFDRGRTEVRGGSQDTSESSGSSYSIAQTVSTGKSVTRSFNQTCLPGNCCVVYRQAVKNRTRAALVNYNLCGVPKLVGRLSYDDWDWNYGLAQDKVDPSGQFPPPEGMPKKQCLEDPCGEWRPTTR